MRLPMKINAGPAEAERYRELLQRPDWDKESLEGCLSLLSKLVGRSLKPSSSPWHRILASDEGKIATKDVDRDILQQLRTFAGWLDEQDLPKVADDWPPSGKSSRLLALAEKTWTFLTLQVFVRPEGAVGLLHDAQSFLYLCAAHYLLEQLHDHRHTAERNCILNAMNIHTFLVWRDRPDHMYYLQSILMDCLNKPKRKLRLLELAFLLTPVDDHSYMTKATDYWSCLMDQGKGDQALGFLMKLAGSVPKENQRELSEMIAETQEMAAAG